MKIEQSGEPIGEVLSLALAKKHCRVRHDDDDELIAHYIDAAVEWVKDACQTVLLVTEFTATSDSFDLSFKGYPNPDISSISYVDKLGASGEIIDFDIVKGELHVEDQPEVSSVSVVFTAGLGAGNIPSKLAQAALLLTASFYLQRADLTADMTAQIPMGVRAMVAHHRSFAFA